jgi:hypothetical protein
MTRGFTLSGIAVLAVAGCTVPDPVSPRAPAVPSDIARYVDDETDEAGSENSCPPQIPESQCEPMTQAEKDMLWWDIKISIKWEIPMCADIGRLMQDFAKTGDVRKWQATTTTIAVGYWTPPTGFPSYKPQRVAIRSDLLGWWRGRLDTFMHEGSHVWYQSGQGAHNWQVGGAYWVEDNCINN